jgi:DNA modification methylase
MTAKVLVGDCREVLLTLGANSIDACVTDPPYGLEFMGKEWDRLWAKRDKSEDLTGKSSSPFLAARVDRYVAGPQAQAWHETWAREVYRVLKPGAHLLAFSGTRTSHRMVCAIEDAGFEIRDCLMWLYGSGFPKSLDVSKALDKAAGAAREVVGVKSDPRYQYTYANSTKGAEAGHKYGKFNGTDGAAVGAETAPATDLARQWDGWGTALKPSYEPIILARKPLSGSVAANVTQYGTGALNIDGCRIGLDGIEQHTTAGSGTLGQHGIYGSANEIINSKQQARADAGLNPRYDQQGRWPANAIFDEESARLLDEMSGELGVSRGGNSQQIDAGTGRYNWNSGKKSIAPNGIDPGYGDTGGASRFFYTSKSSRAERTKGLGEDSNGHPCVKPVDLMQWLCRLICPKGGTVLDPFMGSGSTGIAADREGMHFIGIEQDAEYAEIARKRIVGDCPLFTTLAAD